MTLLVYHGIPLPHFRWESARPSIWTSVKVRRLLAKEMSIPRSTWDSGSLAILWLSVWNNIYGTGKLFGMHPWNIKLAWVQFDSLMCIYIYHAACVSIRVFLCCVVAQVCAVWEKDLQVIIPCLVQLSPSCLDSTDICSLWGTSFPCKTPLHNWIQSMKPFARIPQAATG